MTLTGTDNAGSTSKSSPKNLVTLDILLNLLQARGLNDTADCLQREAGLSSASGSPGRKGEPAISELVAPATEEALRLRAHAASLAQAEQRRRIGSLAQEMSKQGNQMGQIRDLVLRVREAASNVYRPTLEEQEDQIKANELELRELEVICSERDALAKNLRIELDRTSAEASELRRTLEEREDEETKARIQLTRLEEEALKLSCELEAVPVMTQARKIQGLLNAWHDQDGHLQIMVRQIFIDIDRDKDGRLQWNNDEIRGFVRELFSRNGVMLPNWQETVWYEMYRRADVDHSYSLEQEEAGRFARSCFEAALALVLTGQAENGIDSNIMGEQWSKTHMAVPVARSAMTYSSGVVIDFLDHSHIFAPVITANNSHRTRMVRIIETGEHLKTTMKTYRDCDKDGNGRLTWNNGEIRDFISACFRQHGLSSPNEEQMFSMYSKFDKDKNNALDMRECLEMVDALFRSTFIVDSAGGGKVVAKTLSQPANYMRSTSPSTIVRATSPSTVTGARVVQASTVRRASSPSWETIGGSLRGPQTVMEEVATGVRGMSPRPFGVSGSPRSLPQMTLQQTMQQDSGFLPSYVNSGTYPVARQRSSGYHSPGTPMQGATIVTSQRSSSVQGSPRGAVTRALSPNGNLQSVVIGQGYARAYSPSAGGSLTAMPGYQPSSAASQAGSVSGSHVSNSLAFVNIPTQLSRSSSNERLQQAATMQAVMRQSSPTLRKADLNGGQRAVSRGPPKTLTGLAPVLRTRGSSTQFSR